MRLRKTSQYVGQKRGNIWDYIRDVDNDLKHLFESFATFIGFNKIQVGTSDNYVQLDATNNVTLAGTNKGKLQLRPVLIQTNAKALGTPTQVKRGLNVGYSLPIWNTGPTGADEELYWRMRIPNRWDGTTDPQFGVCCTLSAGEDVGDKFQMQLEWQTANKGNILATTTSLVTSEQTVLTGRNDAYDVYFVFFTFNADDTTNPISSGEMIQGRLRRIAASSSEVSNEIMVWDWVVIWCVDKMFSTWSTSTNDT